MITYSYKMEDNVQSEKPDSVNNNMPRMNSRWVDTVEDTTVKSSFTSSFASSFKPSSRDTGGGGGGGKGGLDLRGRNSRSNYKPNNEIE